MIDQLFRPFRSELMEFLEEDFGLPAEQSKLGKDILLHTFTGIFLTSFLKGDVKELLDVIQMKKTPQVEKIIGNLIIRCRNEFDRKLDLHPSLSRHLALYLVHYSIDQIRDNYEEKYNVFDQHTFKQYILKAA